MRKNIRKHFELPDLVENQKKSVSSFWTQGLLEEFELFSYVTGKKKKLHMIFSGSEFFVQKPSNSFEYLLKNQKSYSVSLFIPTRFEWVEETLGSGYPENFEQNMRFHQDQSNTDSIPIYFGEIPLMTERGSFLINGASRVLVNQILRCPSVYFKAKIDQKNRRTYIASFLSEYGSWLRFETDSKNRIWIRIDKSQRIPIYALLKSLGFPESFLKFQLKYYSFLENSRQEYTAENPHQAIQFLWQKLNPGRWNSIQGCYLYLYNKFFNPKKYSIGKAGRLRLNKRLNRIQSPSIQTPSQFQTESLRNFSTLTPEDIFMALDLLLQLHYSKGNLDDIDHLKNRRVRLPGELIQNQLRLALSRVMQTASEKLSKLEIEFETQKIKKFGSSPDFESRFQNLIQTQVFGSTFRELFHTSQLSQYMDETNPLSEITHKRRLSSLGPGGIGRDQAGFAVREIHPSHFGRICPIETPEGQNAGLVGSLASFASMTPEGFLQSPYMSAREIKTPNHEDDYPTQGWYLFTADIEDEYPICSDLLIPQQIRDHLETRERIRPVRYKQEFLSFEQDQIQFFGVSPIQMISCATSLIPFLEHDDANRALMGSNMQRQAVPCIFPEKPFVGTGLEKQTARDSSSLIIAEKSGQIDFVDGHQIKLKEDFDFGSGENKIHTYNLQGFWRSNQNTCANQSPAVHEREWIEKGDLLADGSASYHGEISLGKNLCVAYMPWEGYNFEDAIVISERLVHEDIYTSIHIDRYDIEIRETEYGKEKITRNLIFANDFPQGITPEVEVSSASSSASSSGSNSISSPGSNFAFDQIFDLTAEEKTWGTYLDKYGVISPGVWVQEGDILVGKMTPISPPKPTPEYRLLLAIFETKPLPARETSLRVPAGVQGRVLDSILWFDDFKEISGNSEVSSHEENSVVKAQVFLAHKRRIQIGDKMSGRHGNKGIVSLILSPNDMPFLQDGTIVDIILNPLGVPSRMNVGQVLECLFGLAAKYLKQNYRLLAFDEMYGDQASRGLVYSKLFEASFKTKQDWIFDPNHPGKMYIFDSRTGEPFDQPILVGYSYMFKLIHLVDEKIHARSTGPYSLVTQQPLGGRSKHGGQRLGEMEVWALEGFGAASILHEFLTLKSDDIDSRNTFLFHLMKRKHFPQERLRKCLPESFRVLVHELQALCLSVYYNPDFRLSYPKIRNKTQIGEPSGKLTK